MDRIRTVQSWIILGFLLGCIIALSVALSLPKENPPFHNPFFQSNCYGNSAQYPPCSGK